MTNPKEHSAKPDHEVVIVGSGFSGLCLAIKLKAAGMHDFVVLEKADDVGGVWRDNTYPGCACDIPSALYSFSFAPNPNWSRMYPTQAEVRAYLSDCADRFDVRKHVRFATEFTGAVFDAAHGQWMVQTTRGPLRARVLVNGVGGLNRPAIPELPGSERFAGPAFHSAQWDHSFDPAGKRIAVVGTGASAIQIVPELARQASKLLVFQRTPPWVMPKRNPSFSPFQKDLFRAVPPAQRLLRSLIYWLLELGALNFLDHDRVAPFIEVRARGYLKKAVRDASLRKALTPDYLVGCKRILLSSEYLPSFNRENVQLVTDGIAEVRPHAIVTRDGHEHEVDAIIYGTGFKITDYRNMPSVEGLGGHKLYEEWTESSPSYLGIAVNHFPNFFLITGPNTGLGHNSMVFMIESQVHYIVSCIEKLRGSSLRYLHVKADAQQRFSDEIERRTAGTVWVSGCKSWYLSPGGRNFTLWPGFTFQYWWRTRKPELRDFELADGN